MSKGASFFFDNLGDGETKSLQLGIVGQSITLTAYDGPETKQWMTLTADELWERVAAEPSSLTP